MANDYFAKTPGSTCISNGGKNITRRIENIARFKRYPAGMRLVSICVTILLTFSLVMGIQASAAYESDNSIQLSFASARSTPCTTAAGAFDTYGKAVLHQNGIYRVMCAPASVQEELLNEMMENERTGSFPNWDCGLQGWPDVQGGYCIYNLHQREENAYEGLFVIKANYPPDGQPEEEGKMYLAVQNIRAEKEHGRWVVDILDNFRYVEAMEQDYKWGCMELPGVVYTGTAAHIRVEVEVQTICSSASTVRTKHGSFLSENSISYFPVVPEPDAAFTHAARTQSERLTHLGTAEERLNIEGLGLSVAPVYTGEERPVNLHAAVGYGSGSTNINGESWGSERTVPGWGPAITLNSGGGGSIDPKTCAVLPEYYAADLYINNELASQLDLRLQEEVKE